MKPAVAVIIPVYNAEATVIEAIESVDRQSFRDFVIIAVDDGSTDGSLALLNEFAATRDRVVVLSHVNHGAAYSRNRGIRHAQEQGIPFLAFLDADDVWHKDKLACQMKGLEVYPDADIVVTRQEEIELYNEIDVVDVEKDKIRKLDNVLETICLKNFYFHPASSLVRAGLFNDNSMYDTRFRSGHDFRPFLSFAYDNAKIIYIDIPLYFQRTVENSLQRMRGAAYFGYNARATAIEELIARNLDHGMPKELVAMLSKAKDNHLRGMLYGARRQFSYAQAVSITIKTFPRFRDKGPFFVEFLKSLLYPIRERPGRMIAGSQ